jgi:hypothetical protein
MSTTTPTKRPPGRPPHVGDGPRGRVTAVHRADKTAELIHAIRAGDSDLTALTLQVSCGTPTIHVHSPTTRHNERTIEGYEGVPAESDAGIGQVIAAVKAEQPDLLHVPDSTVREILTARYGDTKELDNLRSALEQVVKAAPNTAVVLECSVLAAPPADEPAPEPVIDPVILEGKITRGQVTHLSGDEARDTVSLIAALGKPRGGVWLGRPVQASTLLAISSEGRYTRRLRCELHEAGGRQIERRFDAQGSAIKLREHIATLVEEFGVTVLLFDRLAIEVGETDPALALDPVALAKDSRVAVVIA